MFFVFYFFVVDYNCFYFIVDFFIIYLFFFIIDKYDDFKNFLDEIF